MTIGGASVGDRDLVRPALEARGLELDFWKVAIRPGKPMLFGRLEKMRVLGLPGNPNSCLIAARVFLVPLIYALLGRADEPAGEQTAILAADLDANGPRQHYMLAVLEPGSPPSRARACLAGQRPYLEPGESRRHDRAAAGCAPLAAGSPVPIVPIDF